MNIALSTIVIFIVLVPGFLWRLGYLTSKHSTKFSSRNFVNELTWSVIPALLLQFIAIRIVHAWSPYQIDFSILGIFLTDTENTSKAFDNLNEFYSQILLYNTILGICGLCFGHICRWLIRWRKLDRKYDIFRFNNKWHYILTGEFLDFFDIPDNYQDLSYVLVDVLCRVEGKNVIYIGELLHYDIDASGQLEFLCLRYPYRRDLDDDDKGMRKDGTIDEDKRYYLIPSEFITIPFPSIINVNIRYLGGLSEELSIEDISELDPDTVIEIDLDDISDTDDN